MIKLVYNEVAKADEYVDTSAKNITGMRWIPYVNNQLGKDVYRIDTHDWLPIGTEYLELAHPVEGKWLFHGDWLIIEDGIGKNITHRQFLTYYDYDYDYIKKSIYDTIELCGLISVKDLMYLFDEDSPDGVMLYHLTMLEHGYLDTSSSGRLHTEEVSEERYNSLSDTTILT